ncbi:SDR family NAD(P)-dependent oxidoreductase [Granulicella cerasi]|uniref:SDR family NAD(P)-dependent oxidoreductase n=1 Tax=Granulicella cerasi TaxID=741063 RepID=A0ABW1ZAF0_9BACT|nr:SDR family oxidoreductase [Granulicella cerasi]
MPRAVSEQHVVITGAAKGLGKAIAEAFHAAGAQVALVDYDAAALAELRRELPGSTIYAVDLSDVSATRAAIAAIDAEHPQVDTLVHNAGFLVPQAFAEMTEERWNLTFNVGMQAAYLFTRAYWNRWLAAGSGCGIYVSSNSGIRADWGEAPYAATKHALEGFSSALGLEGTEKGVYTHTVTPGKPMRTPMSEQNYPESLKQRWVEPSELAPAFVYLAGQPDASLSGKRLSAAEIAERAKT